MPAADPPAQKATTSPVATTTTAATAPAAAATTAAEKADDIADIIDLSTFGQILEMDDDGSDDFSRAIVNGFIDQAEETFNKMDESLIEGDLETLSSLGHFLKGSSATLGLVKVKDYCEKIQHFGVMKDESGTQDVPEEEKCLDAIRVALDNMKTEYKKAEGYFRQLYPSEE